MPARDRVPGMVENRASRNFRRTECFDTRGEMVGDYHRACSIYPSQGRARFSTARNCRLHILTEVLWPLPCGQRDFLPPRYASHSEAATGFQLNGAITLPP